MLSGQANDYHNYLIDTVGPKFGEEKLAKTKIKPPVTLKVPFLTEDISLVEKLLTKFVPKQKLTNIHYDGFGSFDKHIIFSKAVFEDEGLEIQKKLIKKLELISYLKFSDHKKNWNPHSTVSFVEKKENFEKILTYVNSFENKQFDLKFDNITILKKVDAVWRTYKQFMIERFLLF